MMQLAAYGRLGADPKSITTKTGKAMTVVSIAVELSDRDGEAQTEWLGIVAFGRVAETLLEQSKGDLISMCGRVQINSWAAKNGDTRRELQVIADAVISAKSVRPGGKHRQFESPEQADINNGLPDKQNGTEGLPFDDDIPF